MEPRRARLGQRARGKRGAHTGRNPTDRGKKGSKHHIIVDRAGHPLAEILTAANVHDANEALPLVDAIPPVKGPRGRPRRRPAKVYADKAYDFRYIRVGLRLRHITPRIARRGIESSTRLGRYRWVVERTLAWLHRLKRLRIREERDADLHLALLQLGCCLVLYREIERRDF